MNYHTHFTTGALRTVSRNAYGGLEVTACLQQAKRLAVGALLDRAVEDDLLPEPYIERSNREIESLNHHVYDAWSVDGAVSAVVVLVLWYWKNLRKERTRMTKTYYLVRTSEAGAVTVTELDG